PFSNIRFFTASEDFNSYSFFNKKLYRFSLSTEGSSLAALKPATTAEELISFNPVKKNSTSTSSTKPSTNPYSCAFLILKLSVYKQNCNIFFYDITLIKLAITWKGKIPKFNSGKRNCTFSEQNTYVHPAIIKKAPAITFPLTIAIDGLCKLANTSPKEISLFSMCGFGISKSAF